MTVREQPLDVVQFEELLDRGAKLLDVDPAPGAVAQLHRYFAELKHWSRKINLISRESTDKAVVENHFLDSLALLSLLNRPGEWLLDVGSGAGFPGLVCKTALPDLSVSLLEPRLKRVSFLNHVIRTLGLAGVSVMATRLEEKTILADQEQYTSVVGRAVTNIGAYLEMCSRWQDSGTRIICMKGPRYKEELLEAGSLLDGWELIEVKEYRLPFSQASRALLVFQGSNGDRAH